MRSAGAVGEAADPFASVAGSVSHGCSRQLRSQLLRPSCCSTDSRANGDNRYTFGLQKEADIIDKATFEVLNEGKTLTGDLGGKAKGSEVAAAVIGKIA